jgi:hypothetical protein
MRAWASGWVGIGVLSPSVTLVGRGGPQPTWEDREPEGAWPAGGYVAIGPAVGLPQQSDFIF